MMEKYPVEMGKLIQEKTALTVLKMFQTVIETKMVVLI